MGGTGQPTPVVLAGKEHLGEEETESGGAESRGGAELRVDGFGPIDRLDTQLQTGGQWSPDQGVFVWTEAHWTSPCDPVSIQAKLSIWERKEGHLLCLA